MEKLFKILTQLSASFVFFILVATITVLYLTAKPAIEKFGAHFIIDSRWGVVDVIQNSIATKTIPPTAPVNSKIEAPTSVNTAAPTTADNTPSADDTSAPDDGMSMNDQFDTDETIPTDDDTDTGQAGLPDQGGKKTEIIYGGAVPIIGTIFSTLVAMLFSIPVAMGIAVFLSEIANEHIARPIGIAIELLAAIPSIIYGMWALFYFGPFIASIFGGHSVSLLVAGLVLGIMVIPFMAALSRDAINTTPDVLKESAYAMGATKFEVIKDIIFPYAKAGIIGSIIVSLGRAMGETMAVAFVIGGIFKFANDITAPTTSIPVVLANNFAESSGMSMNALFYLSLVLFAVSFITIFSAKYFFLRRR